MTEKTASQRGRSARRKGHQFERDIVNKLKRVFPDAQRQLEYQGGLGVDISGVSPFAPQLKAYANYAPINKIEEVPKTDENLIPLLITKGDRKTPMVVMPLDDWIDLVELAYVSKEVDE